MLMHCNGGLDGPNAPGFCTSVAFVSGCVAAMTLRLAACVEKARVSGLWHGGRYCIGIRECARAHKHFLHLRSPFSVCSPTTIYTCIYIFPNHQRLPMCNASDLAVGCEVARTLIGSTVLVGRWMFNRTNQQWHFFAEVPTLLGAHCPSVSGQQVFHHMCACPRCLRRECHRRRRSVGMA